MLARADFYQIAVFDAHFGGLVGVHPDAVEAVLLRDRHEGLDIGGLGMGVDGLFAADQAEFAFLRHDLRLEPCGACGKAGSHARLACELHLLGRSLPLGGLAVGVLFLREGDRALLL